jgi:V/A-type H+-transporting ATPase subunit A
MPGEEGYPAYLATRLSAFYERSGRVLCQGSEDRQGSVTIIGAVSPPGGDFSEPITQNTLRIAGTFWALDTNLAYRRHFPSVNWIKSYSLYLDSVEEWYSTNIAKDFRSVRDQVMFLLQKEVELQEIVQLVGPDALPDNEKVVLEISRIVREDFLQQSAFSDVDSFCPLAKQYWMLKTILAYYEAIVGGMKKGVGLRSLLTLPVRHEIARMKEQKDIEKIQGIIETIAAETAELEVKVCTAV